MAVDVEQGAALAGQREPTPDQDSALDVGPTLGKAARHFARHWTVYVPLLASTTANTMLSLTFAAWAPALPAWSPWPRCFGSAGRRARTPGFEAVGTSS